MSNPSIGSRAQDNHADVQCGRYTFEGRIEGGGGEGESEKDPGILAESSITRRIRRIDESRDCGTLYVQDITTGLGFEDGDSPKSRSSPSIFPINASANIERHGVSLSSRGARTSTYVRGPGPLRERDLICLDHSYSAWIARFGERPGC